MHETLRHLGQGKLVALLFVLLLHVAVLNLLWSYRVVPAVRESTILMANLLEPPSRQQSKPQKRKLHEPTRTQAPVAETATPRGTQQMVPPGSEAGRCVQSNGRQDGIA